MSPTASHNPSPDPLRHTIPGNIVLATFVVSLIIGFAQGADQEIKAGKVPARESWISVESVAEEHAHTRQQRCPTCDGSYEMVSQATGTSDDRHYDQLNCRCISCGRARSFFFDVTAVFEQYALQDSPEARRKVYEMLDARFPAPAKADLKDLQTLLVEKNPHCQSWAAGALGGIGTPAAVDSVLEAYLRGGLLGSLAFKDGLVKAGAKCVARAEHRLRGADPEVREELVSLLGEIKVPESRPVIEHQLADATEQRRRICYLSLGRLGYREAEGALLAALRRESTAPDDSLIWAMGRCGADASIPAIRPWLKAPDKSLKAAAIVAAGALKDAASTEMLIALARDERADEELRHAAIFGLGRGQVAATVPVLIAILEKGPNYDGFRGWPGIYDEDESYTHSGLTEVCVSALERIGDQRARPVFERLLRDDRYYLDHEDVAAAAAALGWRELVPAIVERLEKDHADNVKLFGKDFQRYAPVLRRLTGQNFGEEPAAWRRWLDSRAQR